MDHGLFRLVRYREGDNEQLPRLWLWSRNREGESQAVASHETALALWALSDRLKRQAAEEGSKSLVQLCYS